MESLSFHPQNWYAPGSKAIETNVRTRSREILLASDSMSEAVKFESLGGRNQSRRQFFDSCFSEEIDVFQLEIEAGVPMFRNVSESFHE
jgi:hypothetical protein